MPHCSATTHRIGHAAFVVFVAFIVACDGRGTTGPSTGSVASDDPSAAVAADSAVAASFQRVIADLEALRDDPRLIRSTTGASLDPTDSLTIDQLVRRLRAEFTERAVSDVRYRGVRGSMEGEYSDPMVGGYSSISVFWLSSNVYYRDVEYRSTTSCTAYATGTVAGGKRTAKMFAGTVTTYSVTNEPIPQAPGYISYPRRVTISGDKQFATLQTRSVCDISGKMDDPYKDSSASSQV